MDRKKYTNLCNIAYVPYECHNTPASYVSRMSPTGKLREVLTAEKEDMFNTLKGL